jgi:hypothetical protein
MPVIIIDLGAKGRVNVCLTNNAAERALRCVPLGRKAWLFCGSDRGGQRAAIMFSLIQSCRSTTSIPRLGSPTSSPTSPVIRLIGLAIYSHGI